MSPILAIATITAMVGAAADAPLPRYRGNEPPPLPPPDSEPRYRSNSDYYDPFMMRRMSPTKEPECKACSRSSKGKCRKHRDEAARRAIMEST